MKLLNFFEKLIDRIENLILKMVSLSFLTWVFIFYCWQAGKITMQSSDFLIFTVAIVGIKSYKRVKEKINGME